MLLFSWGASVTIASKRSTVVRGTGLRRRGNLGCNGVLRSLVIGFVAASLSSAAQAAILFTPFGPNGEGGSANGQVLSFGSGGEVFELDAFVNIAGFDLNGGASGTSAQLSVNPLPAGTSLGFGVALSPDQSDLTLTYTLANNSGMTLPAVWFGFFVDAEIDVAINDYFNEAADQFGTIGAGAGDSVPDQWEADEPGYVFGNVFSNLLTGALDNTNAVPNVSPDDVSLAIGFSLGDLPPSAIATIVILLSDDGDLLGSFALQHFDSDPQSFDALTLSGAASVLVPEPSTSSLIIFGLAVFVIRTARRAIPYQRT